MESLYTLAPIAPPDVPRQVSSMQERQRQTTDKKAPPPMFNQSAEPKRLRGSFLSKVHPLGTISKEAERLTLWKERSSNSPAMGLQPSEQLPASTWSWFHMAWVAVSQQTEIRSRKVQGRSAEMGLPSRRTGHYLWKWNCSTDYGTPASLSTDRATTLHTWGLSWIQWFCSSLRQLLARAHLTLLLDTLRRRRRRIQPNSYFFSIPIKLPIK